MGLRKIDIFRSIIWRAAYSLHAAELLLLDLGWW